MLAAEACTTATVGVMYAHDSPAPRPKIVQPRIVRNDRSSVHASFDSAQTTTENARHWRYADLLSADAALNPEKRRTLYSRARYELNENSSWGKGMTLTLANDTIGTGPRLQMYLKNERDNRRVQEAWQEWSSAIRLPQKLHTMKMSKTVDGESIARFFTNFRLHSDVQLDLQVIECDRLRSPRLLDPIRRDYVDGIHLDQNRLPTAYDILADHPGSNYPANNRVEFTTYPRENIVHWFRADRPDQHRGVTEVATALPLFAFIRRFALATISAAELAANLSMVLKTNMPVPDGEDDPGFESHEGMHELWLETIEIGRLQGAVLPNEWDLTQMMSQHPATTYEMFQKRIMAEMARCLNMPLNIALNDSSDYNFASARMDRGNYSRSIDVERENLRGEVLDRLFNEWLYEAALTTGVLPSRFANRVMGIVDRWGRDAISRKLPHAWMFDPPFSADPQKEASAQATRLRNGVTHLRRELVNESRDLDLEDSVAYVDAGFDSVEEFRQARWALSMTNGNKVTLDEPEDDGSEPVDNSEPIDTSEPEPAEAV